MAGATLAAATGILKEQVLPTAREQLNNACDWLKLIERKNELVEGDEVKISLHVQRNAAIGARKEGDTNPVAGKQGFVKMALPMHKQVGTIKITVEMLNGLKSMKSAVETPFVSESKRIVNDMKRDVNRQLCGTSDGVIATTGTTTASNTVTLAPTTTLVQMRQFEKGMRLDIGTVADPTSIASNREITSVNRTAKTLVISGAVVTTVNGTSKVFRQGSGGAVGGVGQAEVTGLQSIGGTSTLFTVDPSTWDSWQAYQSSNSGTPRTPTELLFETALDEVSIESGQEADIILTGHGVYRNYGAQLTSGKRHNDTRDLKGGVKGLSITSGSKEATLVRERDFPSAKAMVLNLDHIAMAEWGDGPDWMDEDGSVLSRVSGETAYEATLFWLFEQFCDERNCHGLIVDLAEA